MMHTDLSSAEGHGDLDGRTAIGEPTFQLIKIFTLKRAHILSIWPCMAAIDIYQRPHINCAVLEGNPRCEQVVRGAGPPIGQVGVSTDDGFVIRQRARLIQVESEK